MVSKKFGKPRKVIKSILEGDEGPKEFSDFGFIASNPDRQFLLLPIEIKLPAAMGKAPGQMAEFVPRLQKANKIIAVVEENGIEERVEIDPNNVVFETASRRQMAVTMTGRKHWDRAMAERSSRGGGGAMLSTKDVASIVIADERSSVTNGVSIIDSDFLLTETG